MLNNDDKIEINELLMKGHSGNEISKIVRKRKQDVYAEIRKIRGIPKNVEKVQKSKVQKPKIEKTQERKKHIPSKLQKPKIEKVQKRKKHISSKLQKPKIEKVQKPKPQTPKAQTPNVQKPQVEIDREPTTYEKLSAHRIAHSRVQEHVNEKINNLRDVDMDFNRLITQLEKAHGIREDSKERIATEYYLYWSQGDREKAFQIEEKLFTQSGKETYIPSDVD